MTENGGSIEADIVDCNTISTHHQHELEDKSIILRINDDEINQPDSAEDAAAVLVWLYLLFVSALLIGAVVIGCFVVVQYGFIIMVALVVAAGALAVVAATLMSVMTGDAKLSDARSKVDAWHLVVKDKILEEIDNLKGDMTSFSRGELLLTYGDADEEYGATSTIPGIEKQEYTQKEVQHKPKSFLFKHVISPFTKLGKRNRNLSSSKMSLPSFKTKRRKGGLSSENQAPHATYVPPLV